MNEIIPWAQWVELIRPYCYSNSRGRRHKDIEVMLRMYLMQNWFNLSDEGMDEAIYDSYAMRSFLGIDFIDEQVPDATTLLKFRRILFSSANLVKCFHAGRTAEFCRRVVRPFGESYL